MVEIRAGIHRIDLSEAGDYSRECWLVNCTESTVLIDTGMRESAVDKIYEELRCINKTWAEIDAILITHKHGDHIGNLGKIQEVAEARVLAHQGDVPDIEGSTGVELEGLEDGEIMDYCGGIEVIHVPGHSEGNTCYYLPSMKVMIAGDTVFRDEEGNLSPPPERYNLDTPQAAQGIKKLLDYDFDILLLTHGDSVEEKAREALKRLTERIS
jgi:glyoxylase-like metal-dependent hydrolase (beta-lactamase superfamily II)